MRPLLLSLSLLAALPALAGDRTEEIRLTFIPVVEVERVFLNGGSFASGAPGSASKRGSAAEFLPAGTTAWTVDAERNVLSVSGSDEAISKVKEIVRLLDVPARRIQVNVRALRLDAKTLGGLELSGTSVLPEGKLPVAVPERKKGEQAPPDASSPVLGGLLGAKDLAVLEARPAVTSADLAVQNNRAMWLRLPAEGQTQGDFYFLTPRVNGDGTITVFLAGPKGADGSSGTSFLRRVASGQTLLMATKPGDSLYLVVTLRLAPPAPPKQ